MTLRRLRTAFVLAAVALLPFAAAAPASAAKGGIEVLVNDQPITTYAVQQRIRLLQLTSRGSNLRNTAVEELINEKLQLAEAKRVGIVPSDVEVGAAFGEIAKRVKLSPAQLRQALSQSGVDPDSLLERLRAQIAWGKVVRARFQASAPIREQDLVAALLRQDKETSSEAIEYTLQELTVVASARGGAGALNSAQATANQLRNRFSGCDAGLALAREIDNVVVRPIGKRLGADLPEAVAKDLEETEVGRLSRPQKRDTGFVMYAVCAKETVRSSEVALKLVEEDLLPEKGDQFARQYLLQLRRNALIEYR